MASRVIGFRIPEDMAEELEKVCEEHGMSVADFMRSLVDEALYPTSELSDDEGDNVTREEVEILANAHKDLADDVQELSRLIDRIGVKTAKYETEGILGPGQVETMQETKAIKSNIKNLEDKVDKLSIQLESAQDAITTINRHEKSLDHSYSELQKEASVIHSQLTAMNGTVKQLESEITRMVTSISSIKREVKRQPTDDIHILPYTDGSEHKFRVYKGKEGLVKPHRVAWDPTSSDEYVDLNEPLD